MFERCNETFYIIVCEAVLVEERVIIHLIGGTYELFRHFYGLRRFNSDKTRRFGAVAGVLNTVLQMIGEGATHLGVATDHVIESFRNELWSDYKTGEGAESPRAMLVASEKRTALWLRGRSFFWWRRCLDFRLHARH